MKTTLEAALCKEVHNFYTFSSFLVHYDLNVHQRFPFASGVHCTNVNFVGAYLGPKSRQKIMLGRRTAWCVYFVGEYNSV